MRMIWRAWGLGALVVLGLILSNGTLSANDGAAVHVKAQASEGTVQLEVQANGPFEYTTYRPSDSLYVIDLSGVSAGDPPGVRVVASDLVKSYRVSTYNSGAKPVVRLEILLNPGVQPKLQRTDAQDLTVLVTRSENASAATQPAVVTSREKPVVVPAATSKCRKARLPKLLSPFSRSIWRRRAMRRVSASLALGL